MVYIQIEMRLKGLVLVTAFGFLLEKYRIDKINLTHIQKTMGGLLAPVKMELRKILNRSLKFACNVCLFA